MFETIKFSFIFAFFIYYVTHMCSNVANSDLRIENAARELNPTKGDGIRAYTKICYYYIVFFYMVLSVCSIFSLQIAFTVSPIRGFAGRVMRSVRVAFRLSYLLI
jgi:hypothetical protein